MRAPDRLLQFVEDEDHREGEQDLLQVIAFVEVADEQPLDRQAEQEGERNADGKGEEYVVKRLGQCQRRVGAKHVERSM